MDADDDGKGGYRWETEYEKTWEAIKETAVGLIEPMVADMVNKAKRRRLANKKNLRLGMMRHLFIVVDMSSSMNQIDLRPNRLKCTTKILEMFINEFIDQNPISHLGLIVTRNKRAEKLSDLSANVRQHLDAIRRLNDMSCIGEPSLQNALEMSMKILRHMPAHTSKEVLVLMGSLTTCDPNDINQTISQLFVHNIRCSVIGLAAELRICRTLAQKTKGLYDVVMDEGHYKELVYQHMDPPASSMTESSLMQMGFPTYMNDGQTQASMCVCHLNNTCNFSTTGYLCPKCQSKYCDLPVECQVCGLTLVSPAHLARSYHHLFPVDVFQELTVPESADTTTTTTTRECYAFNKQIDSKNQLVVPFVRTVLKNLLY
ncbi:general transcription factor IIH subunit 2-like [Oppia nitens]|uniref:general transcription factor IIH subunit 2-like n=1 Tax=Oppia nitens TaxID=1686743 RepID=UPI0023DACAB4|nr:general transcription factor IIH subunit 2-like [Oppia nitens]